MQVKLFIVKNSRNQICSAFMNALAVRHRQAMSCQLVTQKVIKWKQRSCWRRSTGGRKKNKDWNKKNDPIYTPVCWYGMLKKSKKREEFLHNNLLAKKIKNKNLLFEIIYFYDPIWVFNISFSKQKLQKKKKKFVRMDVSVSAHQLRHKNKSCFILSQWSTFNKKKKEKQN